MLQLLLLDFLGSVRGLVLEQLLIEAEGAATLQAGEWPPPPVQLAVGREALLAGEAAVALKAGEGQLPRVQPLVVEEVPVATEGPPADVAGVAPL